jgi:hypothetical protein
MDKIDDLPQIDDLPRDGHASQHKPVFLRRHGVNL